MGAVTPWSWSAEVGLRLADPRLVDWGWQGEATRVPEMRTQLVAARTVAERLAELATDPESGLRRDSLGASISEIAGPREESLVEMFERRLESTYS
jgi:hypothetical protein